MTKTRSRLVGILVVVGLIILGAFLLAQSANAQERHPHPGMTSGVELSTFSGAVVINDVQTGANTGNNEADGSYAGDGGNGGDIENEGGEQEVKDTTTGKGGVGGDAGFGGAVQTGDALATTNLSNTVNSNAIAVDGCGCDEEEEFVLPSRVRVNTFDHAFVLNRTETGANTGGNFADGSYAGEGGGGGDIENEGGDGHDRHQGKHRDDEDQEVKDSTTGAGGNGGAGNVGGAVLTGAATSRTNIANVINSNLLRIRG